VQYITFVMGNVTADAANRINITRVPPKIIQPCRSSLRICAHRARVFGLEDLAAAAESSGQPITASARSMSRSCSGSVVTSARCDTASKGLAILPLALLAAIGVSGPGYPLSAPQCRAGTQANAVKPWYRSNAGASARIYQYL
jgi:hypothetical protein